MSKVYFLCVLYRHSYTTASGRLGPGARVHRAPGPLWLILPRAPIEHIFMCFYYGYLWLNLKNLPLGHQWASWCTWAAARKPPSPPLTTAGSTGQKSCWYHSLTLNYSFGHFLMCLTWHKNIIGVVSSGFKYDISSYYSIVKDKRRAEKKRRRSALKDVIPVDVWDPSG